MIAKRKLKCLAGAALISLAAGSVQLQAEGTIHYRWINERGYPVHSDRPPPKGVDYEVITTGSGLKRVVTADEGAVPAEVSPRVGNEFTQVDEDEAKRSKKNPELCQRARANLEALTTKTRIILRDDQGEERELSAEEITQQKEKAESLVGVYCP